jgi:hypothetical protein
MKAQIFAIGLLVCLLQAFQSLQAQDAEKKATGLEVEADPFAYIFSGYSLHVGYTFPHFRTSVGVYGIQQPDFFLSNDKFEVFSSGYDLKLDYLLGDVKGLFVGAQVTYGKDRMGLKNDEARKDVWGWGYGVRTGYRFMLGKAHKDYKGLYIVPWIALIYTPDSETIQMGDERYEGSSFTPFPTVHVGWRF